jgi:hypothetical protein
MQDIEIRVEQWKKLLLDVGKKNRLINFKETKRLNIAIVSPDCETLYKRIVSNEDRLSFTFPLKTSYDEDGEVIGTDVQEGDLKTPLCQNSCHGAPMKVY